jgi:hypothetical protein
MPVGLILATLKSTNLGLHRRKIETLLQRCPEIARTVLP